MADVTFTVAGGVVKKLRDMADGTWAEVVALAADPSIDIGDIQLLAGTAIIGKVGIDQTTPGTTDSVSIKSQGYISALSITRTADTAIYTANDVIGIGTGGGLTTPGAAALTFANIGPAAGGEIMLTTAKLEIDVTAIPSGMTSFRLYLYSVTPPSALVDNNAWDLPAGDRASFKGYVDLGSPVDLGSTLYVETNGYNKQITVPVGGSLFGYLVTNGGYTPAASVVKKITLHATGL